MNLVNAKVDKRIPKNRFNFEMPELESLVWLYKISNETCGINDNDRFKELQIFEVTFKNKPDKDILTKIQSAIPYPILFHIGTSFIFIHNKIYLQTDKSLLVNDELNADASSVERLIFNLVEVITELKSREQETLDEYVARFQELNKLQKEIERLTRQRDSEKQPKKKLEMNTKIKALNNEYLALNHGGEKDVK